MSENLNIQASFREDKLFVNRIVASVAAMLVGVAALAGLVWRFAVIAGATPGLATGAACVFLASPAVWIAVGLATARAMALATPNVRVHVAAGTYNTSIGETFPITVQADPIRLLGTNAALTIVDASGPNQPVANL